MIKQPEPYRIKMVEPITLLAPEERKEALIRANYNLFLLPAETIFVDLLTDSGTGAMSAEQWAAIFTGDESYAGSRSFYQLRDSVRDIFGFPFVLPTHQGRGAEHIFFTSEAKKGDIVPSNSHFDTTRGNLEWLGVTAIDLPSRCAASPWSECLFKGNMDVSRLAELVSREERRIPFVMLTITNNRMAGQPVSVENVFHVADLCSKYQKPLYIDACRHAENSYLIQQRDPLYKHSSIQDISRQIFSVADGVLFSAKKDGLCNIGGFIAVADQKLYDRLANLLILKEGFTTYGGLAGRDLAAMAVGLREAVQQDYLAHRVGQVTFLAEQLEERGVPVYKPSGGHAVYVDAGTFLKDQKMEFPGQSLAAALFLEGGIRSCDLGSSMFATDTHNPQLELLRLAIPRRTYTQSHLEYVANIFGEIAAHKERIPNLRCAYKAPVLGHFTARFEVCSSHKDHKVLC